MGKMEAVTVRLPAGLKAKIDELAKNTERSLSSVINEAVENYVAHSDWFIEQVKVGIADADAGRFATPEEVEASFRKWTGED